MPRPLSSVAQTFNLPLKALQLMKSKGLIGNEIDSDEEAWFVLLGQMWGDPDFVKMQIKNMDEKTKKSMLKASRPNPVDTYILTKFEKSPAGVKIPSDELAIEIKRMFRCTINENLLARIQKIRKQVKNARRTTSKASE